MEVTEAFDLIAGAIDRGHAAHGYLIVGDLAGNATELAERVLAKLFPDQIDQVREKVHPDIAYLEPEGLKRIIKVESMRERIVEPMARTAYCGGWKVGVIVYADRMEAPSANAFLKSLEEPTPQTLYLLLTDQPAGILPTIVSRTQRIDLPLGSDALTGEDADRVRAAFLNKDAAFLAGYLDAAKKDLKEEPAQLQLLRKCFFKTLMGIVREVMLDDRVPRHRAFANVEAVETAYRQLERSLGAEMVMSYMLDQVVLP